MIVRESWKYALIVGAAMLSLPSISRAAFIGLGKAGGYALFAGPNVNTFSFNGPGDINGDVAIGQSGKINFANPAVINGTLYEDTGVTGTTGGISITGGTAFRNLTQAVTDAHAADTSAQSLLATMTVPGNTIVVSNPSQSITITGSPGENV